MSLETHEVRILETAEEVWELLCGRRVLHVKGFGSGFGDVPKEQMSAQGQQDEAAVKAIKRFRPDYLVVDGDPWGSGFQRYIKAYAEAQVRGGLAVPELVWVKSIKGSSPTPEEREKNYKKACEWAGQGLAVSVSWLAEATISAGVDRLFGAGCWEKLQGQKFDFRGAVRLLEAAEPDRPEWLRGLRRTAPGREMYLAIETVESRSENRYFEKCSFENVAKGNSIYQHLRGEGREPAVQGAVSFGGGESVLLEFATLYLFPGSGFDAGQAALFPFSRGRPSDPTLPSHEGRAFISEVQSRAELQNSLDLVLQGLRHHSTLNLICSRWCGAGASEAQKAAAQLAATIQESNTDINKSVYTFNPNQELCHLTLDPEERPEQWVQMWLQVLALCKECNAKGGDSKVYVLRHARRGVSDYSQLAQLDEAKKLGFTEENGNLHFLTYSDDVAKQRNSTY